MVKFNIPPHIAWPSFIVFLLMVGIGGAFAALIAARSDGGVQIVDDYYQKAVNWDETMSQQSESAALQWKVEIDVFPPETTSPLRPVEIKFLDHTGNPIPYLKGTVRIYRPQVLQPLAEIPLSEIDGRPGTYRQLLPLSGEGIWDFEIHAESEAGVYESRLRRTID